MAHYQQQYGGGESIGLPDRLREARDSLKILLELYQGVPQSVLGGNYGAWQAAKSFGTDFPGGTDTGLGWPYLRYLGTVTTAWTGLALMYQLDSTSSVNENANPYGRPAQPIPSQRDDKCLPPGGL